MPDRAAPNPRSSGAAHIDRPGPQGSAPLERLAALGRPGAVGRALQLSKVIRWQGEQSDRQLAARGLDRAGIVALAAGLPPA